MKQNAFTLAEILITLSIIGIISVITIPMFFDNLNERINSERHANIVQKVTSAMEQMRAHGLLNQNYVSTEAFVDDLQKYLKISKRCDKDHIVDCWPVEKVLNGEGKEIHISDIKIGRNLHLGTDTYNEGLVLADGAQLIINYNPDAYTIDIGDAVESKQLELPIGYNKKKEFKYTTSVTDSIDFITDVNGKKAPNSETIGNTMKDIRALRIASFITCGGNTKQSAGNCVIDLGPAQKVNDSGWEVAKEMCSEMEGFLLPSASQLQTIYNANPEFFVSGKWYWTSSVSRSGWADVLSTGMQAGGYGYYAPGTVFWGGNKRQSHRVMCIKHL